MRRNLHIYPTPFRHETRILKETRSLAATGYFDRILIAAMWEEGLAERQPIDERREVRRYKLLTRHLRLPFIGKILRHLEWSFRVLSIMGSGRIAVVNCHSLSALPVCVLFKLLNRSVLIYDTHELETETYYSRGVRKQVAKLMERALIRFVDEVIVVSPSIAEWYRREYRLQNVHLVRNLPYQRDTTFSPDRALLRNRVGVRDDEFLFIYQGLFTPGRGIELLLDVWDQMPASRHLVFMGTGPLEPLIRSKTERLKNVHLHPPVPLKDILAHTAGADVGVALFEATCLNYFYVLPNKLFEYLFSGVPVIVSDYPDMARVVDQFDCGWKTPFDRDSILRLIQSIDLPALAAKKAGTHQCHAQSGWHIEERSLLNAYASILKPAVPS